MTLIGRCLRDNGAQYLASLADDDGFRAAAGVVARHALAGRVRAEGGRVIRRPILKRGHERGGFLRGNVRPRGPRGLALDIRDQVLEPVVELRVGTGDVSS